MRLFSFFILTGLFLSFVSCSSGDRAVSLSEKGKNVEYVKRLPDESCEVLGSVSGENNFGSVEVARNIARNNAGGLGATHLLSKEEVVNGKNWRVEALAYRCP